jgi:uncharacterized protein (DUF427 family)
MASSDLEQIAGSARLDRRIDIPETSRLKNIAAAWSKAHRPLGIIAPQPDEESVWDYPRPPDVERVCERATVWVGEQVIADSTSCLRVLETASPPTIYFPPSDVDMTRLIRLNASSHCEWKGQASYFSIHTETTVCERAAWCYPDPHREYAIVASFISFYPSRVTRCTLGDELVRAQAGGFYGGWITSRLVGPFKGDRGTGGW